MNKRLLATALLAAAVALPLGAAADPSPTPQPSPRPHVKKTAKPFKSAVNLCQHATLYTWPAEGGLPNPANVPAANTGERFEIQKGPRYTTDGRGYYETTIPDAGLGSKGFYWVSARCFNLS